MITTFNNFVNENFGEAQDLYGSFFVAMLGLRDQAHVFHWQTESFAQHSAFGGFYDAYLDLVDKLAESLIGVHGRPSFMEAEIELSGYSDQNIMIFLEKAHELFLGQGTQLAADNSEIKNIIDEIIAELDKLKYLLTLK
jgi:DNA-binding ferritin-like protein